MRAETLDGVVDAFGAEPFRQLDDRNPHGGQAVRLIATGAEKMNMLVFHPAFVRIPAGFVFERSAAVFEGMYHTMLFEQGERAEKSGFVDGFQDVFKMGQGNWAVFRPKGFQHQFPDGRGFDPSLPQAFFYVYDGHQIILFKTEKASLEEETLSNLWPHLGSNQGPNDYESPTLTD